LSGAYTYIPQGLNFAKELLDDFKTSKLFQGTDFESCRKGVQMLRDLMIVTAEKMKHRLPKLPDEHFALIAGSENGDNSEVHMTKEIVEDICDQHGPQPHDVASTDCTDQDMLATIDNVIESEKNDFDISTSDRWDYEKDVATSFWALTESDDEDSCSGAHAENKRYIYSYDD
ncbi:hypothetical protein BGZ82_004336, partial [Podila clonocystis]